MTGFEYQCQIMYERWIYSVLEEPWCWGSSRVIQALPENQSEKDGILGGEG